MVHDPSKPLNDMYADIGEFHTKFKLMPFTDFAAMPDDLIKFREKFLEEEATETIRAMREGNHPEVLDGLIDLAYVALGTLYLMGTDRSMLLNTRYTMNITSLAEISEGISLTINHYEYLVDLAGSCRKIAMIMGYNFDVGWHRVHEANMSKVRTERPADSKRGSGWDVVKPEGWRSPILEDLV